MPRITTIESLPKLEQKKRIAGYGRVSSGKDAMLHSLSSQVSYYSSLINSTRGGYTPASTAMRRKPTQRTAETGFNGFWQTAETER